MKGNLFQFIEGQTYFSTSWHAKMSLTLMSRYKKNILLSKSPVEFRLTLLSKFFHDTHVACVLMVGFLQEDSLVQRKVP